MYSSCVVPSSVLCLLERLTAFLYRYKRPKLEPESVDIDTGLVGHIHLNAVCISLTEFVNNGSLCKKLYYK